MLRNRVLNTSRLITMILLAAAVATLAWAGMAAAESEEAGEEVQNYFSFAHTTGGQGFVNVTAPFEGNMTASSPVEQEGEICAMFYVFDTDQALQACCGCPITADQLLTLSITSDLAPNPTARGTLIQDGSIRILATAPNATFNPHLQTPAFENCDTTNGVCCDPADPLTPENELVAWANHIQNTNMTETNFSTDTPDAEELASLPEVCHFITQAGSGQGVCNCTGPATLAAATPTATATDTAATPTATATATATATPTATATATPTATATATASPSTTATATATSTATATATPTATATATATPTATATAKPTATATATDTATPTATATATATATDTATPTATATATATATDTATPTATPTGGLVAPALCPPIGATPAVTPGSAGNYAVLAASEVTNTGSTMINGNLGLTGTSLTGSPMVSGFTDVNNANATNGQNILTAAITQAMNATPVTSIPQQLGGQTLVAGAYSSEATDSSFLLTSGVLTLQGDANSVFIFQMDGGNPELTTSSGGSIAFDGAVNPCNIYWQVGSSATIGGGSAFVGNIMAGASVTMDAAATLTGRALASTAAVTLDNNTISGCVCPGNTPPSP